MANASSKRSEKASAMPRDADGHFVSKDTPVAETSKVTITTQGPIETIQKGTSVDAPLVSVSVANPFTKLIHWLDDIRKKQTTSFSFQLKIPLLALPIFLALLGASFQFFFNLGKTSDVHVVASAPTIIPSPTSKPMPVQIMKTGTIKATYQVKELLSPTPTSEVSPTISESTPAATPSISPSRYVLVDKSEEIIFLTSPKTVNLANYIGNRVVITGMYDQEKNVLSVSKKDDIEEIK